MDIKERMDELYKLVEYHSQRYYNDDDPEISDFEYDKLTRELKQLEKENPLFARADSLASKRVGGSASKRELRKVKHDVPVISLQDVFSKEEVINWIREVREVYPDANFSVEQKIDGLSMSLRYTDGKLTLAETRGDGLVGEDVTLNAFVIPDVLKNIDLLWICSSNYRTNIAVFSIH